MRMQESPGANAGKSPTSIIRSRMHNRQEEEPKCDKVGPIYYVVMYASGRAA
jgi:hypothetical protein